MGTAAASIASAQAREGLNRVSNEPEWPKKGFGTYLKSTYQLPSKASAHSAMARRPDLYCHHGHLDKPFIYSPSW